jgi:hypothetical protein
VRRIRITAAVLSLVAAGTSSAEEGPGDGALCLALAGTSYLYCMNHGYPPADCSRDHTWTITQCAIQFPV